MTALEHSSEYHAEAFTDEERAILGRYFTEIDGPVFALTNLPEVVKGALFARYSRSPKSVRRLFLDEFYERPEAGIEAMGDILDASGVDRDRAEKLYQRVFTEYGDDSVAQLGGVHLACEQASNLLTKILEWGRIASYLEQSTRYIFYDKRLGDRYRYHTPPEVLGTPLEADYRETLDWTFDVYSSLIERTQDYYRELYPQQPGDSDFVYRSSIRAKACDDLRGLLPAATTSNVGIYGSGQAYEMLLLRMRAHPLAEARAYADLMLTELRKVIPAFLRRVDMADRGGAWSAYLQDTAERLRAVGARFDEAPSERPEVTLVDWDPDGERKVAAAALYAATDLPDDRLLEIGRGLADDEVGTVLDALVGDRRNRRHKPGRAMEATAYRFDVLCDYGIFRDLQRHRMLTLEWQRLGTRHGFVQPGSMSEVDASDDWERVMDRCAGLSRRLEDAFGADVAQYAVPFAYRVRFYMHMNAREAFHLLELRTAQGGHADYRRVCQEMHRQIAEVAGHRRIADAMRFVDHETYELERLEGERRAEARRAAAGLSEPEAPA